MLTTSYLNANLTKLDSLCISDAENTELYSKLATIELCGWIEECKDTIIQECASRLLPSTTILNEFHDEVVKTTYGFSYNQYFRPMLIHIIGLGRVIRIENQLNPLNYQRLKSTLGMLKRSRDTLAHTHLLPGVTPRLDAPSKIIGYSTPIYVGLADIERALRRIRI
jgi:hypothetical protein